MKKNKQILINVFVLLTLIQFFGCSSQPARNDTTHLSYGYSRLKIMDLDQMTSLMQSKSSLYKKNDDIQALKDGLMICLSRPDEDGVVEKVINIIQTPLEDAGVWEQSIDELVNESISAIKDENQSSSDQVTYSIVLENLIAEMKPQFVKQYKNPGFATKIIEKIASSEVQLSSRAKSERQLNLMKGSFSASLVAQKLIDKREEFLNKEREKEKK